METTFKDRISEFYNEVLANGRLNRLSALFADDYQPHCARLADVPVLEPGMPALQKRLERLGAVPHQLYRIVADGTHVYAQVRYDGITPIAGADIFRFDTKGRIAEHWNSRQRIPQDMARGVDRFSGGGNAALPMTPERRAEMKLVMTDVLKEMWGKGNAALVPLYYAKSYIQHNPDMPGGYHRIMEIIETEIRKYIEATGGPYPVDIHRIGAEGDLIFVHYSIFMAGMNRNEGVRATNTDIFRIAANNRMIEHWDVLQMEGEPLPDNRTLF